MRKLVHIRDLKADDSGQAIVLVLLVSIMLIATLSVAFVSARSALNQSNGFKAGSQGEMAAQTGLADALAFMRQQTSYSALPCTGNGVLSQSLTAPGAQSSFSVAVSYVASSGTLTCSGSGSTLGGSTVPVSAQLVSTGKAPHGSNAVMKEDLQVIYNPGNSALPSDAIFTDNSVGLSNSITLQTDPTWNLPPNVYVGGGSGFTCGNSINSSGSITIYSPVTLSQTCSFTGDLTAQGYVSMDNSASVSGNVISYGTYLGAPSTCETGFSICILKPQNSIGGNAYETNGNIDFSKGKIGGSGGAYASGSTIISGGSYTGGGTPHPNYSTWSSLTPPVVTPMPPATPFPYLPGATPPSYVVPASYWAASSENGVAYNVVQIPSVQYPTCASFFSGSGDPFELDLSSEPSNTVNVYYAPTCSLSYGNNNTFSVRGDTIVQIKNLTVSQRQTFQSTTSTVHNFSILAGLDQTCSPGTTDITFSNQTTFSDLDVFLYTLGLVNYANLQAMSGQIMACGGVQGSNQFTLTFNPSAGNQVNGGTGSSLTFTAVDKYLALG